MTLGEFIEARRNQITQRKIAEMTGIHESRLSMYCNGLIPNDEHRAAIAAVLCELLGPDISINDFWPVPEPEKAS